MSCHRSLVYGFLLIGCLLVSSATGFAVSKPSEASGRHPESSRRTAPRRRSSLDAVTTATTATEQRDALVQELLRVARQVGQVGADASEEEQEKVRTLAEQLAPVSDSKPARIPLSGVHQLVYSASKGGSSGKIGPLVGKVTQTFAAEDGVFYNKVDIGPLQVSLRAECKIQSDHACKVIFKETTFSLFGQTLSQKEVSGGGVWDYLFVGEIAEADGTKKLVRVMNTPSLFVIEQPLTQ